MTIIEATVIAGFIGAAVLWIMSGVSPLVWIARAALYLEAARLQAIASCVVAWHDYRSGYTARLAMVRAMEMNR
jgi:hypothetical protein